MLKRLLSLTFAVCLFLSLYSISHASPLYKTSQTVYKVTYSAMDQTYYAYTTPHASQGHKTAYIVPVTPKQGETLKQFTKRIVGHTIDIYFTIDDSADGDKEIVRTVIH